MKKPHAEKTPAEVFLDACEGEWLIVKPHLEAFLRAMNPERVSPAWNLDDCIGEKATASLGLIRGYNFTVNIITHGAVRPDAPKLPEPTYEPTNQ